MNENETTIAKNEVKTENDYSTYFAACKARLTETDYHRGLSMDTLKRYAVGYDPEWICPTSTKNGTENTHDRRLIIPTGPESYVARAVDETAKNRYYKIGKQHLFNAECLSCAEAPVFVVEGEIDALSIIDAGFDAVALGGKDNGQLLLDAIEKEKPIVSLILAFDHESDPIKQKEVQKSVRQLANKLEEKSVYFITVNDLFGECKDANEAYQADSAVFRKALETAVNNALRPPLWMSSAAISAETFMTGIRSGEYSKQLSTGFPSLDLLLGGGLQPQLYILGARSALGKTTLLLQIADTLSKSGQDVLFFPLEMSPEDLAAKSLSRLTYELDSTHGKYYAKTALGIRDGRWIGQPDEELVKQAVAAYSIQSEHVFFPAHGAVTVADMERFIKKQVTFGKRPVVIIDYLQLIAAPAGKNYPSDKAVVDANLLALKNLIIQYRVPIICISSLNRSSYTEAVDMASFKESGGIEYTADILIGLNYAGLRGIKDQKEYQERFREIKADAKLGNWIDVEVELIKSRLAPADTCTLRFCPRFNIFAETEDEGSACYDEDATPVLTPASDSTVRKVLPAHYDDEEHRALVQIMETDTATTTVTIAELSERLSLPASRTKRLVNDCGYEILDDGRTVLIHKEDKCSMYIDDDFPF